MQYCCAYTASLDVELFQVCMITGSLFRDFLSLTSMLKRYMRFFKDDFLCTNLFPTVYAL